MQEPPAFLSKKKQRQDQIALAAFSESFDAGERVATQGEALAAIYFAARPNDGERRRPVGKGWGVLNRQNDGV